MQELLKTLPETSSHREALEALLSLYSQPAAREGQVHGGSMSKKRFHEQCFVEIKFAILDNVALTNNYVCIVPIQNKGNGSLVCLSHITARCGRT